MNSSRQVAVVGAGIAGLACAYELQKAGCEVVVFEKESTVGGRMRSRHQDGLLFDIGADHLTNNYTAMRAYCQEFGLPWKKVEFLIYRIFHKGKLVPSDALLSWWTKLKMSLLWFLTPKGLPYFDMSASAEYDTETGEAFMRRRAGDDFVDHVLNGYCAAYQFHLSDEISRAGVVDTMCSLKHESEGWHLHHIAGGMKALPEALATKLPVKLNMPVEKLWREDESLSGAWVVQSSEGEQRFDAVVLACTADVTRRILQQPSPAQQQLLDAVRYASTISVCFQVDAAALKDQASTVWVPFGENGKVASYVNESYKGEECVQEGKSLVSVWLHEGWSQELMGASDEDLFQRVAQEFISVCPWFESPDQLQPFDLQRWPVAMPKFYHGFIRQAADFLKDHQGEKGLWLCGDYLNAPWTEGALRCGQAVAEQILSEG